MIHVSELRPEENPGKYIWHPSDPIAVARASGVVFNGITDALRRGMRMGQEFRVSLYIRDEDDALAYATFKIVVLKLEIFCYNNSWTHKYGARFASDDDMRSYLELYPEAAL